MSSEVGCVCLDDGGFEYHFKLLFIFDLLEENGTSQGHSN